MCTPRATATTITLLCKAARSWQNRFYLSFGDPRGSCCCARLLPHHCLCTVAGFSAGIRITLNLAHIGGYLRECRRIIDIGGHRNPLAMFSVARNQSVVTLDPFTFSLYHKDLQNNRELVQLKIRWDEYKPSHQADCVAVVGSEAPDGGIASHLRQFHKIALEFATGNHLASSAWMRIIRELQDQFEIAVHFTLDLGSEMMQHQLPAITKVKGAADRTFIVLHSLLNPIPFEPPRTGP